MITFLHEQVVHDRHTTVQAASGEVHIEVISYASVFAKPRLPRGTYVFCELDQLSIRELRAAAELYRILAAAGLRVLNDPARVLTRYGLLRSLYEVGINRFDAYRVEEGSQPERWPVFVRSENDRSFPTSDLLHSWDEVAGAIDRAVAQGCPLRSLMIVEYAGEPVRPGLYRKLGMFRVGARSFAHWCGHEDHWMVKAGKQGIAPPELYEEEFSIVRDNPYADAVDLAFRAANIEYGRADFGLVDGKVQIYEINTRPDVRFPTEHPHPRRPESYRLFRQNYLSALAAIDTLDPDSEVEVTSPLLQEYRRQSPWPLSQLNQLRWR